MPPATCTPRSKGAVGAASGGMGPRLNWSRDGIIQGKRRLIVIVASKVFQQLENNSGRCWNFHPVWHTVAQRIAERLQALFVAGAQSIKPIQTDSHRQCTAD